MSSSFYLLLNQRLICSSRCTPGFLSFQRFYCKSVHGDESSTNQGETSKQDKKHETRNLKPKHVSDEAKDAAKKKLFTLLSEFKIDSSSNVKSEIKLAQAVKRPSKAERFKNMERKMTPEEELKKAAQQVANSISDEPQKTEEELNEKLSSLNLIKSAPESIEETDVEEQSKNMLDSEVNKNIMSSVEEVATAVQDDTAPIRSKLTEKLFRLSVKGKSTPEVQKSFSALVKGMRVEGAMKKPISERQHRPEKEAQNRFVERQQRPEREAQNRFVERQRRPEREAQNRIDVVPRINIFQSPPLGIFKDKLESQPEAELSIWNKLEEKKVKLLVTYAPNSAFEEMIMWTEQGKHWKFPIDNEIALGAEEHVGFHEHVFLEENLHGFPTRGPIRYFMELVAVGLSKNPYITAERKVENINWFRDYFKEKEDILKEVGAIV